LEQINCFADLLLPLPVGGTFTYGIPDELNGKIQEGLRVVVQFGKRKIYTALVIRVHQEKPGGYIPKNILSSLDEKPVVTHFQKQLWEWMASYYLCHEGEVLNAALPSAFKLASESKIIINPAIEESFHSFNEKEQLLIEALQYRKAIEIDDVSKILGQQKVIPVIKTLMEKGIILLQEEVAEKYQPKKEFFIRLAEEYDEDEEKLKDLFNSLEKKAKKQLELLMAFYHLSRMGADVRKEISHHELLKFSNISQTVLKSLIEKNVFESFEKVVSRLDIQVADSHPDNILMSDIQQVAYDQIQAAFTRKDVVLLHGVTSSGKTELYIKFIQETINQGKQVLYLLPEIALTGHIINRLKKYFGNRIGVSHSKFNENERVEIWNKVLSADQTDKNHDNSYDIILGARSSVFLPFSNLGLVIVDEEHDPSFKQFDPSPRYNARDCALYLAHLHGAKAILGSATPSMESYFNASEGKYELVEIKERYGNLDLPEIIVVDVKNEIRWKKMKSHFSSVLMKQLEDALAKQEQSILFQNRRGFSLRLECETCNWMPMCRNCDVTLVYHKKQNQLRCHYCGYTTRIPENCPECRGTNLKMKGFGTEKVEEELSILLPGAKIARMDLDTTRSKHSYQRILEDFGQKKTDILVGTQMVTKGLDFDNVSTVGILNADNMLSFPDFRAAERSYQLMAQVSGRSGRKNKRGKVIIQTYNPNHMVIRNVVENNYTRMYQQQILDRRKFKYPPLSRLIQLRLKHKDQRLLNQAADWLAARLRLAFGNRVLGPEYPVVSRVMNFYLKHILLKFERSSSMISMKSLLIREMEGFYSEKKFVSVRVIIDVDPQ
jgi:primosomal protein N' (replication factor Y) (superfamily II helicase)